MRAIITTPALIFTCLILNGFTLEDRGPWNNTPQKIPGKIECEFYDVGGEGIAYHDTDSINNGSGKLNPLNGNPLHEFRLNDGVDISYTKTGGIDDTMYNMIKPEMNQLYVGWTQPGEWINYTIDVTQSGSYQVGLQYTSHDEGGISLSLDNKKISDIIKIPSTYDGRDSITWRQWHHWNYLQNAAEINLTKGLHVLTVHTEKKGNMNYDYLILP
jgi:hypothetical protein